MTTKIYFYYNTHKIKKYIIYLFVSQFIYFFIFLHTNENLKSIILGGKKKEAKINTE